MTPESAQILKFPAHKVVRTIPPEAFEERAKQQQMMFADSLLSEIAKSTFMNMTMNGMLFDQESIVKFSASMEMLRAAMYDSMGVPHYLDDQMSIVVAEIKSKNTNSTEELISQEDIEEIVTELDS